MKTALLVPAERLDLCHMSSVSSPILSSEMQRVLKYSTFKQAVCLLCARNNEIHFEYQVVVFNSHNLFFTLTPAHFHGALFVKYSTTNLSRCSVCLHVLPSIFLPHSILITAPRIYTRPYLRSAITTLFTTTVLDVALKTGSKWRRSP